MGTKFELFSVTFSEVGFRNNRNAHYLLKVKYPNGRSHNLYYTNYSDMVRFLNSLKHVLI